MKQVKSVAQVMEEPIVTVSIIIITNIHYCYCYTIIVIALCDAGCYHGNCTQPGVCQCETGYTGDTCGPTGNKLTL